MFMQYRLSRRHGPRRGFTLVEMLVSVGIILLLVLISVPAIGKAMKSAKRSRCQAQLQQIGYAITYYVQHNPTNELMCFPRSAAWPGQISAFLKDTSSVRRIFNCPSAAISAPISSYSAHPGILSTSNILYSLIQRPSEQVLAGDGTLGSNGDAQEVFSSFSSYTSKPVESYSNAVDNAVFDENDVGISGRLSLRHFTGPNRGANILFVDAHVEARGLGGLVESNLSTAY